MKQIRLSRNLWAVGLLLTLTLSCKKEADNATPTPTAVDCQIKRIDLAGGEYELYESDANGRLVKYQLFYADANGKIPTTADVSTLTYNAQGLLDRVTSSGYYEQFSYTNGALSKIEIFDQNKKMYQFDVTTNANKQITAMKSISFNKDPTSAYSWEYSTTFTLDVQGRYTGYTAKNASGQDYDRVVRTGFEPTMKSYTDAWQQKGLPINVTVPSVQYGTNFPNSSGLPLKEEYYWGYDAAEKYVGLQKDGEYTFSRKANSSGYVMERVYTNAADKSTSTDKYQYSNCN